MIIGKIRRESPLVGEVALDLLAVRCRERRVVDDELVKVAVGEKQDTVAGEDVERVGDGGVGERVAASTGNSAIRLQSAVFVDLAHRVWRAGDGVDDQRRLRSLRPEPVIRAAIVVSVCAPDIIGRVGIPVEEEAVGAVRVRAVFDEERFGGRGLRHDEDADVGVKRKRRDLEEVVRAVEIDARLAVEQVRLEQGSLVRVTLCRVVS